MKTAEGFPLPFRVFYRFSVVTLPPRFGPSLFVITVCGPLALEELVFFFGTDGPKPLVDGAVVLGSTRSVVDVLVLPVVPVVPAVVPSPFASVLPTVILFVTRSFFDTLAVLPAFGLLRTLLLFFELDEFVLFVDVLLFLLLELFVLLEAFVFEPVRLVTRRVPSDA